MFKQFSKLQLYWNKVYLVGNILRGQNRLIFCLLYFARINTMESLNDQMKVYLDF